MDKIKLEKESLTALKGKLGTIKDEFNISSTEIKTNLETIKESWKGKRATETLSKVEELNKRTTDLLTKLQENVDYIESVIQTIDKANSVEVESKTNDLGQTPIPTITKSPNINNFGTTKIDQQIVEKLGLKTNNSGVPIKVGNAYMGNLNGMDYLVHIPTNNSGEVPNNLPIFVEFHGSGEAGENINITGMPQGRMGLKQIQQTPNFQAIIIIPQVKNPNYYASEYKNINDIQKNVISSFSSNENNIVLYGHSAGATGGLKYASNYPEGVKLYVSIDGRPDSSFVSKLREENIPILFANSNNGKGIPYNVHIDNIMYNYPNFENLTYNVNDIGIDNEVDKSIDELIGTNDLKAIYLTGSTHTTVRDKIINSGFYDAVLERLNKI